mmetsp:Transcript_86929/g.230227  ORF Transcript_86929/g.230227 Transcript_86929/m.230227 type:complete len:230 (-) Transcript_86929:260-949(-)
MPEDTRDDEDESSEEEGEDEPEPKATQEEQPKDEDKKPAAPAPVEFKPHDSYPPMTGPVEVEYCPHDGLPPDFCQYGSSWEKSKPWCIEHYPHYYPELSGVSLEDAKKAAQAASDKSKVKELPGGKVKRAVSPRVTIKKLTRGGRKCVTSVTGLEGFDVKMEAVAKAFKTRFACGCAVVKGDNGLPDSVDIQGDFGDEVIEQLCDKFKIPKEKCTLSDGGTKKAGKKKA